MLQKPANNGTNTDVLRKASNARAQCANATHDQVNFYACTGCAIQRFDHFRFEQGIHLRNDVTARAALAALGNLYFIFDRCKYAGVQRERRLPDARQLARFSQAGQLNEHLINIRANFFVGCHQAEIRVQPRRAGVVIAGAKMHVTP